MGKAKRKINKLQRKKKKKVKERLPIAPPTIVIKSKKEYDRKKDKPKTKEILEKND